MVTRNRLGPQALDGPSVVVYSNPTNDPRAPAAPISLHATTSVYQLSGGGYAAACTLIWSPPTTDADGNPMVPASIKVWGRKGIVTPPAFAELTTTSGDETTVTLEGLRPNDVWQFKVRAQSVSSTPSLYSNTITVTMPKNDPPPLPPSVPTLSTHLGTVTIRWDGKASGGGAMPTDTDHVRVERHAASTFLPATGITLVGTILPPGGPTVDGSLTVGNVWFYRLIAVDKAGQESQPSAASEGITVEGITAPDIPLEVITPGMLSGAVAGTIAQAGIDASLAQTAAANAAKIFSKPTKPTLAVDAMKVGDLWFDTANGNKPYRYQLLGPPINANDWVSIRDATLSAAFPGGGTALDGSFIDAAVVRAKLIAADVIDAKDIIASGSITSASGVFGLVNASVINAGTLDADRIGASSITASKIFLGDTENLVDEPRFANDGAWNNGGPPAQIGASVTVSDLPLSGAGKVWQVTGNATIRSVPNTRRVAVAPNDSFYAEGYVRKTATGTTGTVQLLLNIKRKGAVDTTVLLASKLFKTTDAANAWFKISTLVYNTATPPVLLTTGKPIPALGYEASLVLRVLGDVVSGNVQFGDVMVRRQNTGQLIVDGTITSNQIAARTITAGDIFGHTITAAEIFGHTITAAEIKALTITANEIYGGTITGDKIKGGTITGDLIHGTTITAGNIKAGTITGTEIKGDTITSAHIHTGTITAGDIGAGQIHATNIGAGAITATKILGNQITATHLQSNSVTAVKIKTGAVTADKILAGSVSANKIHSGSINAGHIIAGAVTSTKVSSTVMDAKTITGATVRTAAGTGRRVSMSLGGLAFYSALNVPLISLSTASGTFTIRSNSGGARIELTNSGLRLYNSANVNTVNLSNSGAASFKGTVTASNINSPTINGATFGGTQSGGTFSGATQSGGAIIGTVGLGGVISGGTVRTGPGGNRVQIAGDKISFYSRGELGGTIAGDIVVSGLNITPGGFGKSIFFGSYHELSVGQRFMHSHAIYDNTSTSGSPVYVSASGFLTRHTSSERYKQEITDLGLAPGFMDIRTATWRDKPNKAAVEHRLLSRGSDRFTGFLADDLHRIGLTDVVVYDRMARPDGINVPSLLAHTVRYVQHLVTQVDELTERVAVLEGAQA